MAKTFPEEGWIPAQGMPRPDRGPDNNKEGEHAIRRCLGIPEEASLVIIFSESSHWDPNWLLTSEEYFRHRVRKILDAVIRELLSQPRRVFGLESIFFLKMYWERRPEKQDSVRLLVNQRRLRLTGSGITTPDMNLPHLEAIVRDFLLGQEWLRANGMDQEPRIAYLPDDFGFPPTVPTILNSLGCSMAVVTRIDGSFFVGADYAARSKFPRPGSSAELLSRVLKSSDFVWAGPDGSQVLCHWNAFTYGQGDMIAAKGVARWMGLLIGVPARSTKHVSNRIGSYVHQLLPLARTPYVFCPIGLDFNSPVRDLVGLLDSYNREIYPDSGIFAVNASLDDYLDLVSCYQGRLPELRLDLSPYWMGFYSSRPEIKQRCRKIVQGLVTAEKLLTAVNQREDARELLGRIESAWETTVATNHHDFITGTSPGRVWRKEQKPWLVRTQDEIGRILEHAVRMNPEAASLVPEPRAPGWSLHHGILRVETDHYLMEVVEAHGGCMLCWTDPVTTEGVLEALGNDVVAYADSGGLWRMGHEYLGGSFVEWQRSSQRPARISAVEDRGVLRAEVDSELEGRRLVRTMWFRADSPFIRAQIKGSAGKGRTVACRFSTRLRPVEIEMDVPGGVVSRPLVKMYDPTFWAAADFAHVRDRSTGRGFAVFMGGPASISANGNGIVEWVALRNAPKEKAFGFLPLLAHPAYGEDPDEHLFDYAVAITRQGDWRVNRLHVLAHDVLSEAWINGETVAPATRADAWISTGSEDVRIVAIKPAHRGQGLIVRLMSFGASSGMLEFKDRTVERAFLCDARERDLEEIRPIEGRVEVSFPRAIVSLRVMVRQQR